VGGEALSVSSVTWLVRYTSDTALSMRPSGIELVDCMRK
jgi:hypothetical protein